jgi:hypothetical protein
VDRRLCDRADGIFVMAPAYLSWVLAHCGDDLAAKAYLFADPFTQPRTLRDGEFVVYDPSFEARAIAELLREFAWFRDRVVQIHEALNGQGNPLVPAMRYRTSLPTEFYP